MGAAPTQLFSQIFGRLGSLSRHCPWGRLGLHLGLRLGLHQGLPGGLHQALSTRTASAALHSSQTPRNRVQSFLRIIRHPTGLKATYPVHPNIPFPGRPGSPQGKPGHFFGGLFSPRRPTSAHVGPRQPTSAHIGPHRPPCTTARLISSLRAPGAPPEAGRPGAAISPLRPPHPPRPLFTPSPAGCILAADS